ncbi:MULTISPECIES: M23 family metallopeptidase [unclassified Fusibacter]|uniref:M23 family metallopeptidase n=1 Tax=unclassified Fusibacter TaxID=2624464 RepID=UPI001010A0CC|nr:MULTISPECIES: M23 family metallopeptidase [unclassified Fusibacter]MCK8060889.1 peptidoglycan DD-metalloendopeptidase family protein [Fusibacter sp. A2]NPE23185.1 peptidoglycan DD-metalloendopeptidase family protein [Fusibacter sp. A1]RXV59543.1 LysM peptidoglycan-binding domain-containing protein [Fusibacter sp. A1]
MSIRIKKHLSSIRLKTENSLRRLKTNNRIQIIAGLCVCALVALPVLGGTMGPVLSTSNAESSTDSIGYEVEKIKEIMTENNTKTLKEVDLRWTSGFILNEQVTPFKVECVNLLVNGQVLAQFSTTNEAQKILDKLMEVELTEKQTLVSVGFLENVKIKHDYVEPWTFGGYQKAEDVLEYIRNGGAETKYYTVKENDTVSGIAQVHGIYVSDIIAANPILSEKKYLQIGDEIRLNMQQPLITVETKVLEEYVVEVKPQTTTEPTSSLYVGEQRVKVAGTPGVRQVNAEVVYENKTEVARVIKSEMTLTEAKPVVMYTGTKTAPATVASGNLQRPASGYIVFSRYGNRSLGYHSGIDLSMPQGTPIYAAAGGTVVFSGNQGTYGLLVKIDHGDGTTTLYAHNSKLLVKNGDKVLKGQQISLSGNTGRSTGPHLHFEVRINDVPVNPEKYLNF